MLRAHPTERSGDVTGGLLAECWERRPHGENVCDLFGRKVSTVINDFLTHEHADIFNHSHTRSEMHMHTCFEEATYRHVVYKVHLIIKAA